MVEPIPFPKFPRWQASQLTIIKPLIAAVLLNISLTLIIWVFVYGTETDRNAKAFYLLDKSGNFTTGDDIYDGLLNGVICLLSLATLSFIMLAFALYDYRKLLQFWLVVSCLLINFLISTSLFRDMLIQFNWNPNSIMLLCPIIYGLIGCKVFFTNTLPSILHQFYVICNCSMVSVFYLRTFPNQTSWFVLIGIIIWDMFAVLTPFGPLRRVTEKANDYSETILRLLMYNVKTESSEERMMDDIDVTTARSFTPNEVNTPEEVNTLEEVNNWEFEPVHLAESEEDNVAESSPECNALSKAKRTAYDALQDANTTRLGMGDFVFYSVLVGKAAVSGSVLATLAAVFGVVAGLIITLTMFPDYEDSIPALPVSILLGIVLHFATLLVVEPVLQFVVSNIYLCDVFYFYDYLYPVN